MYIKDKKSYENNIYTFQCTNNNTWKINKNAFTIKTVKIDIVKSNDQDIEKSGFKQSENDSKVKSEINFLDGNYLNIS